MTSRTLVERERGRKIHQRTYESKTGSGGRFQHSNRDVTVIGARWCKVNDGLVIIRSCRSLVMTGLLGQHPRPLTMTRQEDTQSNQILNEEYDSQEISYFGESQVTKGSPQNMPEPLVSRVNRPKQSDKVRVDSFGRKRIKRSKSAIGYDELDSDDEAIELTAEEEAARRIEILGRKFKGTIKKEYLETLPSDVFDVKRPARKTGPTGNRPRYVPAATGLSEYMITSADVETRRKWRLFDEGIRGRLIRENGFISDYYRTKRCLKCISCGMSVCDAVKKPQGAKEYPGFSPCSFCMNNGWECEFRKFQEKERPYAEVWNIPKLRNRIMKSSPEVQWIKMWKRGPTTPDLPDDLKVESNILDSIHRAISHHTRVYEESYGINMFKSFDSQALLAMGYLAEELIREQLKGLFTFDTDKPIKFNPAIEELDRRSLRKPKFSDITSRLELWTVQLTKPPLPPYLLRAQQEQREREREKEKEKDKTRHPPSKRRPSNITKRSATQDTRSPVTISPRQSESKQPEEEEEREEEEFEVETFEDLVRKALDK